ncbi:MAG: META domain-containing protein [Gammaproteobacteria bacterium]|nr:META domain-containing protein [Gammaproteobacteria bacterium]
MKAMIGFLFFMLFLGGLAFVNLKNSQDTENARVTSFPELADAAWQLTHLGDMVVDDDTDIYIQFRMDGQFDGNTGCNRFFGNAEFAEALSFGGIGATRRACPEPANSYELSFLEALGNTTAALRVDDRLAFRNADDQSILRFVAVPRISE